jgi:glycosyltransferase involved in cell wall biosynthesis
MDFVCFSINNWEKRRARKQQFMKHLSLRDDVGRVMYIEPPLNFWRLVLLPLAELKTAQNRARWRKAFLLRPQEISEKFFLYTPIFFIPFSFRVRVIYNVNLFLSCRRTAAHLKRLGFKDVVLWLYHPFDLELLDWFKERVCACFDWAEEWANYFVEYSARTRKQVRALEERILSRSDIVFVVSETLFAEAKVFNPRTYLLRDGTEPRIFQHTDERIPQDLRDIPHPIIGYSGTFFERMDRELILRLSRECPDCSLVFVGDVHDERVDITELRAQKNIFFLGGKAFEELGAYLSNFDVCIIPYRKDLFLPPPTKVFDYLACGKPVVAIAYQELQFLNDVVRLASTHEDFIAFVKEGLNEHDAQMKQARLDRAYKNSWDSRVREIVTIITSYRTR